MRPTPCCCSRLVSTALFKSLFEKLDILTELGPVIADPFGLGSKLRQLSVIHTVHKPWSEEARKILDQTTLDREIDQVVREHS